jgi:transcriptional regulator of acetoin/glycerol metabolism
MRKRARMLQELNGLIEDNAGKSERDRTTIWRKIQKFLARNDDIANE